MSNKRENGGFRIETMEFITDTKGITVNGKEYLVDIH